MLKSYISALPRISIAALYSALRAVIRDAPCNVFLYPSLPPKTGTVKCQSTPPIVFVAPVAKAPAVDEYTASDAYIGTKWKLFFTVLPVAPVISFADPDHLPASYIRKPFPVLYSDSPAPTKVHSAPKEFPSHPRNIDFLYCELPFV